MSTEQSRHYSGTPSVTFCADSWVCFGSHFEPEWFVCFVLFIVITNMVIFWFDFACKSKYG